MILVHDRGAGRELREVAHQGLGVPVAPPPAAALHRPFAEELRLGDDRYGRFPQPGALFERCGGDPECRLSLEEVPPALEVRRTQARAGQRVPQVLTPSRALRHQQRAAREVGEEALKGAEGLRCLRVDRHAHRNAGVVVREAASRLFLETSEPDLRVPLQSREHLVDGEEELGGGEQGTFPIVTAVLETLRHLIPESLRGVVHVLVEDGQGGVGQVVEKGCRALEEERQVVLDAGGTASFAHFAVDGTVLGVALETGAPGAPEASDRALGQGKLPRGKEAHALEALHGALGFRIEGADAVHLVVQQIDAQGMGGAARIEVEEGAAHRELAVVHDLPDAPVAEALEAGACLVEIQAFARSQHHAAAVDEVGGRQAAHQGGDGDDQGAAAACRQPIQSGQTFGDDVLVRGEQVVGQGLPVGKVQDLALAGIEEEAQLGFQSMRGRRVGHQHQHQAGVTAHGLRNRHRAGGAVQVSPPDPPSGTRRKNRFEWRGHSRDARSISTRAAFAAPGAEFYRARF